MTSFFQNPSPAKIVNNTPPTDILHDVPLRRHLLNGITLAILLLAAPVAAIDGVAAGKPATSNKEFEAGKRIYTEGLLSTGAPLTGMRFGNSRVSGSEAACVNCHRRSGMGSVEGNNQVSPVSSHFLFVSSDDKPLATMDPTVSKRFNQSHEPYTDETLARAIRHGVNNRDLDMNNLMPHYEMGDAEMKSLIAYLRQLSVQWSPGVTRENINFATVITPDVDPERRQAFINMMRTAFKQKNASTLPATRSGTARRHMVSAAEMVLGTERNWSLDIWELKGAPETWGAQLDAFYRAKPVFALVSGLSDTTWAPIHAFCEREQIPGWFPSVALPALTQDTYSLYFNRGVALEADVLAQHLLGLEKRPKRLVQVYRDDEAGRGAALALKRALASTAMTVEDRVLPATSTDEDAVAALRMAQKKTGSRDVMMFWLRQEDVLALGDVAPVPGVRNYFSARLARVEPGLFSPAWKAAAHLVYPYEMPEKREANLAFFRILMNIRRMEIIDEPMQSEVFFSLNYLTDTVSEMLHNLYRDYLLERGESMLNKREGSRAEQEMRERLYLGGQRDLARKQAPLATMKVEEGSRVSLMPQGDQVHKREGTTIYPRLSLGPGQRFASKGGYIVRFADSMGDKLVAETDWIVP